MAARPSPSVSTHYEPARTRQSTLSTRVENACQDDFEAHCGFSAYGGDRGLKHQGHDALGQGLGETSWHQGQIEVVIEQGHSDHGLNATARDARIQGWHIWTGKDCNVGWSDDPSN